MAKPVFQAIGLRRSAIPAALSGKISQDFSPGHLRKAVESSLRRLQSDHIDLYQFHSPPREALIDESLLKTRNQIAHGDRIAVSATEYDTIEREIRGLIDHFQQLIETCIQQEKYRAFPDTDTLRAQPSD